MYSPEQIQARLREKPFRPLRIVGSEGLRFDIYHPDLILVGTNDIMIGHANPAGPTIYDRVTRLALIHLVAIEELPVAAASGNGQS
jgi:hypothetical protein